MVHITRALTSALSSAGFFLPSPASRSQEASALADPGPPTRSHPRNFLTSRQNCWVEPYNVDVQRPTFEFDPDLAEIFRYRQQQSVNLGSWFVQEKWMVPSVFRCAAGTKGSELDIASGWGGVENARQMLERHWDTFVTEDDFAYLASVGINTVRLPVGYWTLGPQFTAGTDFEPVGQVYRNAWPRVLRAIQTAAKYNIGVLVDLHGAPGSANGEHHSGTSDGNVGLFSDPWNIRKTREALVYMAKEISGITNVVGLQILNEPRYGTLGLEGIYDGWISAIRQVDGCADLPIYLHDAFDLERFSAYISKRSDFVVQDYHSYFVYTDSDANKPAWRHAQDVAGPLTARMKAASNQERRNLIVGEWSCALTPNSLAQEQNPDWSRTAFCTNQEKLYREQAAGWHYWSYKTENCDAERGWCFRRALGDGLPSSFSSFGPGQPSAVDRGQSGLILGINLPALGDILGDTLGGLLGWLGLNASPKTTTTSSSAVPITTSAPATTSTLSGEWPATRIAPVTGTPTSSPCYSSTRRSKRSATAPSPSLPAPTALAIKKERRGVDSIAATRARGYSDGFGIARKFAAFNLSKLGFTGQYVVDAVARLTQSGDLQSDRSQEYVTYFWRGLADGETRALQTIGR